MTADDSFSRRTVSSSNREFVIQVLKFENGCFVSLAENKNRLGSVVLSLGAGPGPVTTTAIPAKTDPLFLKMIAEKLGQATKGVAIVSSSVQDKLDAAAAGLIAAEIDGMVK